MTNDEIKAKLEYGIRHIEFAIELYKTQSKNGLYFVHEHPAYATSWGLESMQQLLERDDVYKVVGDMCKFDMTQKDNKGEGFIRKHGIHDELLGGCKSVGSSV